MVEQAQPGPVTETHVLLPIAGKSMVSVTRTGYAATYPDDDAAERLLILLWAQDAIVREIQRAANDARHKVWAGLAKSGEKVETVNLGSGS